MTDLWGFLLQTLTASGVAVLLLSVKALFRDKLPPKWHFATWSILGLLMLIPAGLGGRYTLIRWSLPIEILKGWLGEYGATRVRFPFPLVSAAPESPSDWLFLVYAVGVLLALLRYAVAYLRLRTVLRRGTAPSAELAARVREILAAQGVKPCRIRVVAGLPAPFVCGVIRPMLAIPAEGTPDDMVILHEALHLRHRDTLWSVVICLLRCLHWCNPLIRHCANRATNDMESRCDADVLACLEGEERREYGRLLLSMANERFSRTPGSTCVNNGGKNLRERIEAIARYKRYPVGMGLVSVCLGILLALPLAVGVQASAVYEDASLHVALASARTVPCTTPAGAFDAYAKAVLDGNGYYRAMCAPEAMQAALAEQMKEREAEGLYPDWDNGLTAVADRNGGYYIYNLNQVADNAYEGLLVLRLAYPPEGEAETEEYAYLAVQTLRTEREDGRWVVSPQEDFRFVEAPEQSLTWGCLALPYEVYAGVAADMRAEVLTQTVHTVNSRVSGEDNWLFGSASYFDTTPKPNAAFTSAERIQYLRVTHLGTEAERESITQIGLSIAPVMAGETRPESLTAAVSESYSHSSSNNGAEWASLRPNSGWGPALELSGGGSSFEANEVPKSPAYYAADLYLNGVLAAEMELYWQEVEK